MSTIKMVTPNVYGIADNIQRTTAEMVASYYQLNDWVSRLSSSWYGSSAEEFSRNTKLNLSNMAASIEQLEALRVDLIREIQQWEQVAASFTGTTSVSGVAAVFGVSRYLEINLSDPVNWVSQSQQSDFNYFPVAQFFLDATAKFADIPGLNKFAPFLGVGLGIYENYGTEDDLKRLIGGEVISGAIGLFPPVALYNLGLGALHLKLSVANKMGFNKFAENGQEFLKKLDFSDKMGYAIYDYASQDPVNFINMLQTLRNPTYIGGHLATQKFFTSFVADNLRDFGWDRGASWLDKSMLKTEKFYDKHIKRYDEFLNPSAKISRFAGRLFK